MLVRHKNPTFNGTVVLATTVFRFESGIAEVAELSTARQAAIAIKGWSIVEPPVEDEAEPEPDPAPKRKTKLKKDFELNEEVPAEDMEVPEPEIG